MKRDCIVLLSLALFTSVASAIDTGPKGRLYSAGGPVTSNSIVVNDVLIDENWFPSAAMTTEFTLPLAGIVNAVAMYQPSFIRRSGTGYGAIAVGFAGKAGLAPGAPSAMQVARLTIGSPVSMICSGRLASEDPFLNTQGATWAWFSPRNYAGGYAVVMGGGSNYRILRNQGGTYDIGDSPADYIYSSSFTEIGRNDINHTQLLNSLYASSSSMPGLSTPGIYYSTVSPVDNQPSAFSWFDQSNQSGLASAPVSSVAASRISSGAVYHQATWSIGKSGDELGVMLCVDKNDDGDALDATEAQLIYTNASVPDELFGGRDNIFDPGTLGRGTGGMQFIIGPGGRKFLMLANTKTSSLLVLQLNQDGTFAGAGSSNPQDFIRCVSVQGLQNDIAFDYYVRGDGNGDNVVNGQDIYPFLKALAGEQMYYAVFPNFSIKGMDLNEDGAINGQDIYGFLSCLQGTDPYPAPEPLSLSLLGLGGLGLIRRSRR